MTTRGTSGSSRAGPSPNVGSTGATVANSRPSATSFAINGRSLVRPPRRAARTVGPNSPGQLHGMVTSCTKSASRRDSLRRARHEQDTKRRSEDKEKKKGTKDREKKHTPTTKAEMWACMIPGTLSQSFCAYFEGPIALLHYERYNSSGWHSRTWADLGVTLPGRHGSTMRE